MEYFTEKIMDSMEWWDFKEKKVKKSDDENLKKHIATTMDQLGNTSVLQGFKCEDIDGIRIVKFWYGFTKNYNFIPIAGNFVFLYMRSREDTTWKTLCFDIDTKRFLSDNIETARKLKKQREQSQHLDEQREMNRLERLRQENEQLESQNIRLREENQRIDRIRSNNLKPRTEEEQQQQHATNGNVEYLSNMTQKQV